MQAPPHSPRFPSAQFPTEPFAKAKQLIWNETYETSVFPEPSRHPQALLGPSVIFRAHVALRAVFVNNVAKPDSHHNAAQGCSSAPVYVDAVCVILRESSLRQWKIICVSRRSVNVSKSINPPSPAQALAIHEHVSYEPKVLNPLAHSDFNFFSSPEETIYLLRKNDIA